MLSKASSLKVFLTSRKMIFVNFFRFFYFTSKILSLLRKEVFTPFVLWFRPALNCPVRIARSITKQKLHYHYCNGTAYLALQVRQLLLPVLMSDLILKKFEIIFHEQVKSRCTKRKSLWAAVVAQLVERSLSIS